MSSILCEPQPSLLAPLLTFHCCFFPSRFQPAGQNHLRSCPPPCHPAHLHTPLPLHFHGIRVFPRRGKKHFPCFSLQISPVQEAGGWVLPGLIEIRLSTSWLAISPAHRGPEPRQSGCSGLIRHRAAPETPALARRAGNERNLLGWGG